jgi:hypothetical protein
MNRRSFLPALAALFVAPKLLRASGPTPIDTADECDACIICDNTFAPDAYYGDGVRDDTAFVQACIDSVRPLPPGTYRISGPVHIRHPNVRISGSTFVRANPQMPALCVHDSAAGVVIAHNAIL